MESNADAFASGTLSLVMSWICVVPLLISFTTATYSLLTEKAADLPKWFILWVFACLVFASPLRYIVLQLIVALSFPVQSWRALFSSLPMAAIGPLAFGAMAFIGVGLPLLVTHYAVQGRKGSTDKVGAGRLAIGFVVAPLSAALSWPIYFIVLQFAAYSTHWLRAADVIGATNGPALTTYTYVLGKVLPLPINGDLESVTKTDRDMLRNHVASFYLGEREYARYVSKAYPDLYQSWPLVKPEN